MSPASSHLKILDRSFLLIKFLLHNLSMQFDHRRLVGALTSFLKIVNNSTHLIHGTLPAHFQPSRHTPHNALFNAQAY